MKINPILKKELGIKARTMKFTWIVAAYNVIIGIIAFLLMSDALGFSKEWGYMAFNKMALMYQTMAMIEMFLLLVIIPSITGASIAGEREKRTLDLLLTSKLTAWQIISGKLQTCVALMMILVVTSLPILSLSVIFGGIRLWDIVILIIFLFIYIIFISSVGVFFSTVFKKTSTATILTYLTLIVVMAGSMLAYALFYYVSVVKSGQIRIYEVEGILGVMIRGLYYIAGFLMDKIIFKKLLQALIFISRFPIFRHGLWILMVLQLGISCLLVRLSALKLRRKG